MPIYEKTDLDNFKSWSCVLKDNHNHLKFSTDHICTYVLPVACLGLNYTTVMFKMVNFKDHTVIAV